MLCFYYETFRETRLLGRETRSYSTSFAYPEIILRFGEFAAASASKEDNGSGKKETDVEREKGEGRGDNKMMKEETRGARVRERERR